MEHLFMFVYIKKYIGLGIIVPFIIFDLYFLFRFTPLQSWGQSTHMNQALYMYESFIEGDYRALLNIGSIYPPFYYISTLPFILISKYPPVPVLVNIIYTGILSASVYILAGHFF